jgi:hypothetical protein
MGFVPIIAAQAAINATYASRHSRHSGPFQISNQASRWFRYSQVSGTGWFRWRTGFTNTSQLAPTARRRTMSEYWNGFSVGAVSGFFVGLFLAIGMFLLFGR